MGQRYANQLIGAAEVVKNVNHGLQILPANERQARPLTQLSPDEQAAAWQRAVETAPDGRVGVLGKFRKIIECLTLPEAV